MEKRHIALLFIACCLLHHAIAGPLASAVLAGKSAGYNEVGTTVGCSSGVNNAGGGTVQYGTAGYGEYNTGGYNQASGSGAYATNFGSGTNYQSEQNEQFSSQGGSETVKEKNTLRASGNTEASSKMASSQYGVNIEEMGVQSSGSYTGSGGGYQSSFGTGMNYGATSSGFENMSKQQQEMQAAQEKQNSKNDEFTTGGRSSYLSSSSTHYGGTQGGGSSSSFGSVPGGNSKFGASQYGASSSKFESGFSDTISTGGSKQDNKQSSYLASKSYSQVQETGTSVKEAGVFVQDTEGMANYKSGGSGGVNQMSGFGVVEGVAQDTYQKSAVQGYEEAGGNQAETSSSYGTSTKSSQGYQEGSTYSGGGSTVVRDSGYLYEGGGGEVVIQSEGSTSHGSSGGGSQGCGGQSGGAQSGGCTSCGSGGGGCKSASNGGSDSYGGCTR